ncbi:MAG TPA: hypothetical protein VI386_17910 [Candidatus Sulfotelmatobacter sp.]
MNLSVPKAISEEVDFIRQRVEWMKTQPQDRHGALLDLDLVLEAGTLRRRIDELETLLRLS